MIVRMNEYQYHFFFIKNDNLEVKECLRYLSKSLIII